MLEHPFRLREVLYLVGELRRALGVPDRDAGVAAVEHGRTDPTYTRRALG